MKPIALAPSDFSAQGFDFRFFYGAGFLGPLGPNEIKLGILDDHVLGQMVTKPWLRFQQLHQLLRQMLKCRNHEVLMKD